MLRSQIMSITKHLNQAIFNSFQTKWKYFLNTYTTYVGIHNPNLYKKHLSNKIMLFAIVICQYLQPQNSFPWPFFWSNDRVYLLWNIFFTENNSAVLMTKDLRIFISLSSGPYYNHFNPRAFLKCKKIVKYHYGSF